MGDVPGTIGVPVSLAGIGESDGGDPATAPRSTVR